MLHWLLLWAAGAASGPVTLPITVRVLDASRARVTILDASGERVQMVDTSRSRVTVSASSLYPS